MDQEAADELCRGQPHDLLAVAGFDAVVLPAEGDGLGIGADQARIRDRHPVGVTAQIGQYSLRPAKGWLGVVSKTRLRHDGHPFGFAEWGEPCCEVISLRQPFETAKERQLTSPVQIHQPGGRHSATSPRIFVSNDRPAAGDRSPLSILGQNEMAADCFVAQVSRQTKALWYRPQKRKPTPTVAAVVRVR